MSAKNTYFQALIVSLGLHCLLYIILYDSLQSATKSAENVAVEITYAKDPDPLDLQPLQQKIEQLKQKLLSDKKRTSKKDVIKVPEKPSYFRMELGQGEEDFSTGQGPALSRGQTTRFLGSSQFHDLPMVQKGGFTSLNTDQFTYYAFFSRVNERIGPRWGQNIREFVSIQPDSLLRKISGKPRITNLEFVLDTDGNLLQTHVLRSSGYPGLDRAAIEAFTDSAPLQNPPEGMVGEDGKVHVAYSFYIYWRPSRIAGSR